MLGGRLPVVERLRSVLDSVRRRVEAENRSASRVLDSVVLMPLLSGLLFLWYLLYRVSVAALPVEGGPEATLATRSLSVKPRSTLYLGVSATGSSYSA